jgi:hypothetical protein
MSGFNPTSAGAGVTVSSTVTFASVSNTQENTGEHVSCYVGGLSKLCHKNDRPTDITSFR